MKADPHRKTQESVDPESLGSTKALFATSAPFSLSLSVSVSLSLSVFSWKLTDVGEINIDKHFGRQR
jgi:hypothetical protein